MAKRAVAGEGRRRAVNTKITDAIRKRLEVAAASSDRTLSHEIEHRLERSFDDRRADDLMSLEEAIGFFALNVGGEHNLAFSLAVGSLLHFYEQTAGMSWRANDATKAEVEKLLLDQIPRWVNDPPAPIAEHHRERFEKLWNFLLKHAPRADRVGDFGDAPET